MVQGEGRWGGAAKLLGITALLTPVTILIHELAHLTLALASGHPAQLHPASVSGGAGSGDPAWLQAAQAGAGPVMTLVMAAVGTLLFRRSGRLLWLAFAGAAVSRFMTATIYLGIRLFLAVLGKPFGGNPNFDEHAVASALGLNPLPFAAAAALALVGTLWLLLREVPKGRRLISLLALAGGSALGFVVLNAIAPAVLLSVNGG